MSDGISRIELKTGGAYGRYRDDSQQEESGLLGTAPDPASRAEAAEQHRAQYDEEGLLPVMIENGLDKIGIL